MSVPVAGEAIEVGFRIRQHGVTRVNPDDQGGEPVAVVVRSTSGGEVLFPARQDGPTGHYVADVTFPDAGGARWEIRQGWFGTHDLGEVDVADVRGTEGQPAIGPGAAAPQAAPAAAYRWPLAARARRSWWRWQGGVWPSPMRGAAGVARATPWRCDGPRCRCGGHRSCGNARDDRGMGHAVDIGVDLSDAASWAADRRPGMSAEDDLAESVRTPGAFIFPRSSRAVDRPARCPRSRSPRPSSTRWSRTCSAAERSRAPSREAGGA
jgi:hypothetical protein